MPRWKWFLSAKHNSACLPNVPVRFRTESGPSQVVFTLGSKNGRRRLHSRMSHSLHQELSPFIRPFISVLVVFGRGSMQTLQCGGFNKKMKES